VAHAAPRIGVDEVDQLGDGVDAVAHHVPGHPLRHRHHPAVDDQDAVVVPFQARLDEHAARNLGSFFKRLAHLLRGLEPDGHRPAVVAVARLHHHRIADALRLLHRLLRVVDHRLPRHRQSEVVEDLAGQLLVRRDLDGDGGAAAGERRLDTALVFAMAELHQGGVVQAQPGNAALLRRLHQRGGRRSQSAPLGEAHQAFEFRMEVERRGIVIRPLRRQQMADQPQREIAGGEADRLLDVAVDHVIVAARQILAARLAERHRRAHQSLQLDRHVLKHMAEPGAPVLVHPPHEAARLAIGTGVLFQGGDQDEKAVREAGQPDGRIVFQLLQIHRQADRRPEGILVGTAIDPGFENLHVGLREG